MYEWDQAKPQDQQQALKWLIYCLLRQLYQEGGEKAEFVDGAMGAALSRLKDLREEGAERFLAQMHSDVTRGGVPLGPAN